MPIALYEGMNTKQLLGVLAMVSIAACDGNITGNTRPVMGTGNTNATASTVSAVFLDPSSFGLNVGATAQLSPRAVDANGSAITGAVTWTTSNGAVASVDSNGVVTGRGAGSAIITATVNGRSGNAVVTVT